VRQPLVQVTVDEVYPLKIAVLLSPEKAFTLAVTVLKRDFLGSSRKACFHTLQFFSPTNPSLLMVYLGNKILYSSILLHITHYLRH
jgi:hypothetical protein